MVINNAITDTFKLPSVQDHHGLEACRRMCEKMVRDIRIDKLRDEPLPLWAIYILTYNIPVGLKEKVRMCLLHHEDITGDKIQHKLTQIPRGSF